MSLASSGFFSGLELSANSPSLSVLKDSVFLIPIGEQIVKSNPMSVALSLILARTNPAGRVYQLGASSARRRPARLQSPRPARPIRAAGATSGKRITCLDAAHPGYGQIETCRASERRSE